MPDAHEIGNHHRKHAKATCVPTRPPCGVGVQAVLPEQVWCNQPHGMVPMRLDVVRFKQWAEMRQRLCKTIILDHRGCARLSNHL